ncbi:MAG: methyltransferase domain-containing protein [Candidatus Pacebacteria bacterium]|nr:methyltransferase domain-containing protein [Candidatus Paceibacterota bacterium]
MQAGELYDLAYSALGDTLTLEPAVATTIAVKHAAKGKALDIGCGQGRDTLFLAESGFDVVGIDISRVGIERLNARVKGKNLKLKTVVGDVRQELLKDEYTLIVCNRVLQDIPQKDSLWMIERMQSKTLPRGVNFIAAYGHGTLETNRLLDEEGHFFGSSELRKLYVGWEILYYSSDMEQIGRATYNPFFTIVAQKPK